MARKRLGEILVEAGVLDDRRLGQALAEQRRWGGPLGRLLVEMRLITEETMVRALSHQLNMPMVDLDATVIDQRVLDLIAGDLAEQHEVIPFQVEGKFLDVAMSDPSNLGIVDELRIRTRLNVRPYLAGPSMIVRALAKHYSRGRQAMSFGAGGFANGAGADESFQHLGARTLELDGDTFRPAAPNPPREVGSSTPPLGSVSMPSASARRAAQFDFTEPEAEERNTGVRDLEIAALQMRVQQLEALVARDEDVLRKLLALLVEKRVASREEILERIK